MILPPLIHSVEWHAFTGGPDETDDHGNAAETWAEAPDVRRVYGWAPAGAAEPRESGRDASVQDLDLLVPAGFTATHRDRVKVRSLEYEVEGGVQDYSYGPFNYRPGGVIRLRRVTG